MEKTWKPTVAGILDIVAGVLGMILALLVTLGILVFGAVTGGMSQLREIPLFLLPIILTMATLSFFVSVLAIVGGVYALQRKVWGLALAGSIAAFFGSSPLGIIAIVLTALSKNEFE